VNREQAMQFLVELTRLTHKYGIRIDGWGYEFEGLVLEDCSKDAGRYIIDEQPWTDWSRDIKWVDE
jgi:hypothetical protein